MWTLTLNIAPSVVVDVRRFSNWNTAEPCDQAIVIQAIDEVVAIDVARAGIRPPPRRAPMVQKARAYAYETQLVGMLTAIS